MGSLMGSLLGSFHEITAEGLRPERFGKRGVKDVLFEPDSGRKGSGAVVIFGPCGGD